MRLRRGSARPVIEVGSTTLPHTRAADSVIGSRLRRRAHRTRAPAPDDAADAAVERAERAGVRISGPLGLCFPPAFICLGIAPVVIGLASSVLGDL